MWDCVCTGHTLTNRCQSIETGPNCCLTRGAQYDTVIYDLDSPLSLSPLRSQLSDLYKKKGKQEKKKTKHAQSHVEMCERDKRCRISIIRTFVFQEVATKQRLWASRARVRPAWNKEIFHSSIPIPFPFSSPPYSTVTFPPNVSP